MGTRGNRSVLFFVALAVLSVLPAFPRAGVSRAGSDAPEEIPLSRKWSGQYPVARLDRLPEGQRETPIGYFGDRAAFAAAWEAFQPGERVPEVDFGKELVVFCRNVHFYNVTSIAKVLRKGNTVEVLAIETLSARPIEDKVAMAMAVIPREGIRFLSAGADRIPVSGN